MREAVDSVSGVPPSGGRETEGVAATGADEVCISTTDVTTAVVY